LGALLVDIRPRSNRELEGELPGALVVERIHLEWRLDPASEARLPQASYDAHVIVVCNEGYSSSLAAAALQDLGVNRATDLVGGFRAWWAAGLPTLTAAAGR
jgi:rhodanese-related sulfurtransferase